LLEREKKISESYTKKGGEKMKTEQVPVSYRDQEAKKNVPLGTVEVSIPETIEEAQQLYGEGDLDKGTELLLEYATTAYTIEKQRLFRDANRPDKPQAAVNLSKFKQLSPEKQRELLVAAGIINASDSQQAAS
jgi:hypothetical protein